MPIRVENLCYTYNPGTPFARTALEDINLEINDGEFVGIIGETGSGKSTLIQHFNGLLRPTRGRVLVDGVDIWQKDVRLKDIRQKVGLVFQYPEHQLFEETVFADVAFGPRNMGLDEDEIGMRVRRALEMVGLDFEAVKARSPFELSGGEMRRVAIAGVLAMEPSVLVLDEPVSGLDPRGRDELLQELTRLHEKFEYTVVLVSHSMEDVARLAKRLVVMHRGRVVADGPVRDVFRMMDLLRETGLGVPQVTELMLELARRGKDVRTDVLTVEEAKVELLRLLRSEGRVR
ncbi:MAG: energy-coupling factor transport system ATP-binding protein [Bacillota bacterium]|nr:energy-coupling factor transporter ATPase [Bacillota bacterium]MDK2931328.1 energy-coupling factor transport system ATP-binding protein [Bacillota bacterium]